MKTRVVGYARISPRPVEGLSIENQIEKIRAYCIAMDLELVDVVVDNLLSGKSLERPALRQALMALRVGEADGLLITKLDRLTRSVRDLGDLVEQYFSGKHSLHCIEFAIDTKTANGRMILNILVSLAQWERENTVEKTTESLAYLKTQGVRVGRVPYGMRHGERPDAKSRCTIEAVDAERAVAARMRVLALEGWGARAIAAKLDEEGVKGQRGGRWHATQVRRVLKRLETET